ncbi:UNKNOWN [Stylonychia lemnae]|uniref:C2 NT-type domain-containing protein n=1 Tax=Stylonychia lemnae TaxID=5949 RepID=A0A077ZQ23_STYLE|nr:UNKNOWN [Stylonychia lemnae]|eukprot:CDW72003.1 UNKNOWN [Stylonychia lemnae]
MMMEALSFKIEIKLGVLQAFIPQSGELMVTLKDEDTRINQNQSKINVDFNCKRTSINQTYTFISTFKPISHGSYEQRYLSLTFQLNTDGSMKPLGLNRLEMSQFLQNGMLGQPHNINLKVLKCPFDVDAQVSLQITFLEQVHLERNSDTSYVSETSSRVSQMSDLRGSIGGVNNNNGGGQRSSVYSSNTAHNPEGNNLHQENQNENSTKVLAQSRSEKNIAEIKFNKANVRVSKQNGSPDQNYQKSTSQPTQMIKVTQKQYQKMHPHEMPQLKIDSLIKSLNNEDQKKENLQEMRLMQDQIQQLQKQVSMFKSENDELRGIKQNQDLLIAHLKQQNLQLQSSKSNDLETQQLRAQLKDVTDKYQHLLSILRDQQSQSTNYTSQNHTFKHCKSQQVQQIKNNFIKSVNTTGEEDSDTIDNDPFQKEPFAIAKSQYSFTDHPNTFDSREEFKSMPFDFTIKDKYNYVKNKLSMVLIDKNQIEQQLINAKMQWATLDLQRDNLTIKLKQSNERYENLQVQMNGLQDELVRTKQELGEAMNSAYEYEKQNSNLLNQYENRNSTASAGGSTAKNEKKSKTSKIKSLFKMSK